MKKIVLLGIELLAILLLLSGFACAYTNPTDFIINETHLVSKDESLPTYLEITFDKDVFHVVKIAVNGEFAGFIALNKAKGEIVEGTVTLNKLFTTAKFYEELKQFKENLKNVPSVDWFITKGKIAKNLAEALDNEESDLVIVDNQLNDLKASLMISGLKTSLGLLSAKTFLLADAFTAANDIDFSFSSKPFVGGEKELKTALIDVFEMVIELDTDFLEYKNNADTLKKYIGTLDLDIETKKSLNNVLEVPENFSLIGNWAYNSTDFKNQIDAIYKKSTSSVTELVNSFNTRLQRENTFKVLYEEDSLIKTEFGEEKNTVKKAVEFVLANENVFKWKAKDLVQKMQKEWNDAEEFFNKNQFNNAENSAKKAKNLAIKIHKQGFAEEEEPTDDTNLQINYDLLFTGGLGIIILLIVLYLIRNRKKFASFLGKEAEEEGKGIDIYEWK